MRMHAKGQAPLDPIEFQNEIAKRTEEERIQLENFKRHEEKMK